MYDPAGQIPSNQDLFDLLSLIIIIYVAVPRPPNGSKSSTSSSSFRHPCFRYSGYPSIVASR